MRLQIEVRGSKVKRIIANRIGENRSLVIRSDISVVVKHRCSQSSRAKERRFTQKSSFLMRCFIEWHMTSVTLKRGKCSNVVFLVQSNHLAYDLFDTIE